jgi:hypothetical protein
MQGVLFLDMMRIRGVFFYIVDYCVSPLLGQELIDSPARPVCLARLLL